MKTLTLLESHQSVGEYYLQCESAPVLTRQDDGIRCQQSYKLTIPLLLDQKYEIKGSQGLIPTVKVTSQAWPILNALNGAKSSISDSTTTNVTTSKCFEKTADGRILLHIQTKLVVNARLRIENMTTVAPMASPQATSSVEPTYQVSDNVTDHEEGHVTVVKKPQAKTTDIDHLRKCIELVNLNMDPTISPCSTPLSSRPSSVAESMLDSAIIADFTGTDCSYAETDAASSIFSEDMMDELDVCDDGLMNKDARNNINQAVNPNWNEIAAL